MSAWHYYHGEVSVVDVIQLVGYIQYTMRSFTFLNVGIYLTESDRKVC